MPSDKKALTNIDIINYAKKANIPYFRNVFMRNTLPKNGPLKNESGVVNLDVLEGIGTHWVAYKKRGNLVIYFDSFGDLKPPIEIVNYFKKCKIIYNYDTFQKFNTINCGHLCLKFLNKTQKL